MFPYLFLLRLPPSHSPYPTLLGGHKPSTLLRAVLGILLRSSSLLSPG